MNIRTLIISLVAGLIVLAAGFGLGNALQKKPATTAQVASQQTQVMPDSIKVLSSNVIAPITARGKVSKIDGNNFTLLFQTASATIAMRGDTKVYILVVAPPSALNKSKYMSKQVALKDIKVGDNVEVNVRVLTTGQIEGYNIIILPRPVVVPTTPIK